jgi:hypothetical protein
VEGFGALGIRDPKNMSTTGHVGTAVRSSASSACTGGTPAPTLFNTLDQVFDLQWRRAAFPRGLELLLDKACIVVALLRFQRLFQAE